MDYQEIWHDIKGYDGIYQVSNLGRVKSITRKRKDNGQSVKGRILKQYLDKRTGYYQVKLMKEGHYKTYRTHRLVALTFIKENKNKTVVNHINAIKTDNRVENLEWCNQKENMQHALDIRLKQECERKYINLGHTKEEFIKLIGKNYLDN